MYGDGVLSLTPSGKGHNLHLLALNELSVYTMKAKTPRHNRPGRLVRVRASPRRAGGRRYINREYTAWAGGRAGSRLGPDEATTEDLFYFIVYGFSYARASNSPRRVHVPTTSVTSVLRRHGFVNSYDARAVTPLQTRLSVSQVAHPRITFFSRTGDGAAPGAAVRVGLICRAAAHLGRARDRSKSPITTSSASCGVAAFAKAQIGSAASETRCAPAASTERRDEKIDLLAYSKNKVGRLFPTSGENSHFLWPARFGRSIGSVGRRRISRNEKRIFNEE
ncbi:hypothetical protein EVAR_92584_1 [Eumeta japonica]|uniref:Uncharacterized protein n=1 Tax=Eumeta variegata TaxID=151549 RepID=A0A4C1SXB3_EUMVA|nr:hypothetical protein EVAR_92584_1 [Eumeta japonica]